MGSYDPTGRPTTGRRIHEGAGGSYQPGPPKIVDAPEPTPAGDHVVDPDDAWLAEYKATKNYMTRKKLVNLEKNPARLQMAYDAERSKKLKEHIAELLK